MAGDIPAIALLSLLVSASSTLLATLIAVPLGTFLGLREIGSARLLRTILYTLYGLPPVLAGLLVYLVLSRPSPVYFLLYTPLGMVLAQAVVVTPVILGVTTSAVSSVERRVKDTAFVLGADSGQLRWTVIKEAASGILTAVMVGFGRAISEVGAVLIVGGNIPGKTQVLTTTIITEIQKGNTSEAGALGAILLVIGAMVYYLLYRLQERTLP